MAGSLARMTVPGISIRDSTEHPKCSANRRDHSAYFRTLQWVFTCGGFTVVGEGELRAPRRLGGIHATRQYSQSLSRRPNQDRPPFIAQTPVRLARCGLLPTDELLPQCLVRGRVEPAWGSSVACSPRHRQKPDCTFDASAKRRSSTSKSVVPLLRTPVARNCAAPADCAPTAAALHHQSGVQCFEKEYGPSYCSLWPPFPRVRARNNRSRCREWPA